MDKGDVYTPNGQEVGQRSDGERTAISCPACGAPCAYNQAGCGHCGSGLLKNIDTEIAKFGVPNDAMEWPVGEEPLYKLLGKMEASAPDAYSYVVWKGLPVVVGKGVGVEEAIQRYHDLVKQVRRDKLGTKWTRALEGFNSFQNELRQMDDETRIGLNERYYEGMGPDTAKFPASGEFFTDPSFSNFEHFSGFFEQVPGDDADQLNFAVNDVRGKLQPPQINS
jgi:hypothetical protein